MHKAEPKPDPEKWYENVGFNKVVNKFHDDYCRQPEMADAMKTHERFKNALEISLRAMDICKRLEFKGSSYEGIKVKKNPQDSDLEFDILVVMVGGDKLEAVPVPGHPGFVMLKNRLPPATSRVESLVTDGVQLSEEIGRKFFGALQKCINNSDEMKDRVILLKHGPSATQMDVYVDRIIPGRLRPAKFYSVDMVPCYEVAGKIYIMKQLIDGNPASMSWRQCLSLQEKFVLNGIDRGNGIRKWVIRVLKVLRNASPELLALSSFHFKMTAFHVFEELPSDSDWVIGRIGVRVIDVLKKLESFLASGHLPLCFLPEANLLDKFSPDTLRNLRDRVHVMCTKEREITKLMENYGR